MTKRPTRTAALTVTAVALLTAATVQPASAQSEPVPGRGNVYYLSGAHNTDGQAQAVLRFGNADDVVYFGDWYGDGIDLPLVRRGNTFHVPSEDAPSVTADVFAYGDAGDVVLVGDWNGDGVDSLAVRRGNRFFVKDDNTTTGTADTEFSYGDAGDTVLVGNWNRQVVAPSAGVPGKGDTLMVRRGNRYFVKNDLVTGPAEYSILFGDPGDTVLVADWVAYQHFTGTFTVTPESGDGGDQLIRRQGNRYFVSGELWTKHGDRLTVSWRTDFGDPNDDVFVASFPTPADAAGNPVDDVETATQVITGDGLAVRRTR
jgi:hypothetical protein